MKKLLLFFLFISFGFYANSQHLGIEIYAVKNSYQNKIKNCKYCFDKETIILSGEPLLKESDILFFNWKNQQIVLSEKGKSKISKLKIELSGMPVIMALNKKSIYGFWFWNKFSSFGCDRVYAYPQNDFKIKFGLPSKNTFSADPRFNEELKKYILNKFLQN